MHCIRHPVDPVDGDHSIRHLRGHGRAGHAHRNAEIRECLRGRIVDPTADHDHRAQPRVVAQPPDDIEFVLGRGCGVICAGGGGFPTMYTDDQAPAGRRLVGIEAVVDKDHASARLAADIDADMLVIATDVDAVYLDWGQPGQRAVRGATPEALSDMAFPEGSMGPKVQAACAFAQSPGRVAAMDSSPTWERCCAARRARS